MLILKEAENVQTQSVSQHPFLVTILRTSCVRRPSVTTSTIRPVTSIVIPWETELYDKNQYSLKWPLWNLSSTVLDALKRARGEKDRKEDLYNLIYKTPQR